jgi:L-ascorbate metabolism protein UlaG (beta-lactamase superfamily)
MGSMSKALLPVLLIAAACVPVWAQENRSSEVILKEIQGHHQGTAVWWMGNAGWLIKSGDLLIASDLDLEADDRSDPKILPPPLTAQQLAGEVDVAFATHQHGDHCNLATIKGLAQGSRTTFVLPRSCLKEVASLHIPKERIVVPEPLQPFDVKGIHVEPIHAIHGNQDFTVLTREPDFVENIAHNCGYVFNIGGKRMLEPGDSVLTEEHLNLKNIDVLFVSPTIHNMFTDRSMILINQLQPSYIFPQHFGTYQVRDDNSFWTRGYPDELKMHLSQDLQKRYHQLKIGDMFEIR